MKANFNKWWLLPSGILIASALIALSIVALRPAVVDKSFNMVAQREPVDCSGSSVRDYGCYQQRYQALVRDAGVVGAFDDLKDQYENNDFVRAQCHQMTHVIGRAAYDVYGDLSNTFGNGDNFCWSGYYHGAMEALAAKIGPDEIVNQANDVCSDYSENQRQSFYHYNCVHGLGHGFMGVLNNELFESLDACDTMTDDWERESCYGGVFMENVMAENNPNHPSRYLEADQPLYPCTDVEGKYKKECYKMQTSYALKVEGDDFSKVFDLCGEAEDDYRDTCYQSLGRDASGQASSDVVQTKDNCMMARDDDGLSNCVIGAAMDFVSYYSDDAQAKELCRSFEEADLHDVCLKTTEDYYDSLDL